MYLKLSLDEAKLRLEQIKSRHKLTLHLIYIEALQQTKKVIARLLLLYFHLSQQSDYAIVTNKTLHDKPAETRKSLLLCAVTRRPWFQFLKEIMSFIVYKYEGREVFYANLPYCFHSQFRIFHTLNALDAALRKHRSNASNGTQIEATMLFTCIGYNLSTVSFGYHHE